MRRVLARLGERVPVVASTMQKPLVWRIRVVFGEAALNFLSSPIGLAFRMQTPGGVGRVDVTLIGRLVGLVTKCGRVGIVLGRALFQSLTAPPRQRAVSSQPPGRYRPRRARPERRLRWK